MLVVSLPNYLSIAVYAHLAMKPKADACVTATKPTVLQTLCPVTNPSFSLPFSVILDLQLIYLERQQNGNPGRLGAVGLYNRIHVSSLLTESLLVKS